MGNNKKIKITITGNDLFYFWIKGIKAQLETVLLEKKDKDLKKGLKKIIKLL